MFSHNYFQTPWTLPFLGLHITAGFFAVYGGLVPLFMSKGGSNHRIWGKTFVFAMVVSSVTSIPLAIAFKNWFQIVLGVFGVVSGIQLWRFSNRGFSDAQRVQICNIALSCGILGLLSSFALANTFKEGALGTLVYSAIMTVVSQWALVKIKKGEIGTARIQVHILSSITALMLAWSALLNTQLQRLTGLELPTGLKLLIPVILGAPLAVFTAKNWDSEQISEEMIDEAERFATISRMEGFSLLLLILIAVPLKRLTGIDALVKLFGPAHGVLFVMYLVFLWQVFKARKLSLAQSVQAVIASLIPFGFLFVEKRLLLPKG